jgi:formate dehydrogenase major subunit
MFIKGLGSGATALALSDVILPRTGWAGAVHPAKTKDAKVTTSICSFCAVGCGLIAHTKEGKLVNLEGDPDHPINQGALCSKDQALREIVLSPRRLKTVHYRAPGADHWEEKPLEWAVQTLAQRLKATRDAHFIAKNSAGLTVNRNEAMAAVGGSQFTNEECYRLIKLNRALGMVYMDQQAGL